MSTPPLTDVPREPELSLSPHQTTPATPSPSSTATSGKVALSKFVKIATPALLLVVALVAAADLAADLEDAVAMAEASVDVVGLVDVVALLEAAVASLAELVLVDSAVAKVVSISRLPLLLHQTRSLTLQHPTARPLTLSTYAT